MRYSFFSDLHIKSPGDEASILIKKLFADETFRSSDHIIFLGDIFDALIGEHTGYLKKYDYFFKEIVSVLDSGKKVTYLEGNHDFHIVNTFKNYIQENSKNPDLFEYRKDGFTLELNGKKYYICHGDEVDFNNKYFKRWKSIYTSKPFELFVNHALPFELIDYLGDRASQNSKKRGSKTFDFQAAKEKYLSGAKELITQLAVDGVICGHTHIQENHFYDDGSHYINCGYPLGHKNFLTIKDEVEFINLVDSSV